jgi:hypothetical protein
MPCTGWMYRMPLASAGDSHVVNILAETKTKVVRILLQVITRFGKHLSTTESVVKIAQTNR